MLKPPFQLFVASNMDAAPPFDRMRSSQDPKSIYILFHFKKLVNPLLTQICSFLYKNYAQIGIKIIHKGAAAPAAILVQQPLARYMYAAERLCTGRCVRWGERQSLCLRDLSTRFPVDFRAGQSKCTKAGRQVWRVKEQNFQAIYLKIA